MRPASRGVGTGAKRRLIGGKRAWRKGGAEGPDVWRGGPVERAVDWASPPRWARAAAWRVGRSGPRSAQPRRLASESINDFNLAARTSLLISDLATSSPALTLLSRVWEAIVSCAGAAEPKSAVVGIEMRGRHTTSTNSGSDRNA